MKRISILVFILVTIVVFVLELTRQPASNKVENKKNKTVVDSVDIILIPTENSTS